MASSEILQQSKESFLSLFWSTLREAEAAAPKENNAALSIQRVYRGTIGRERIAKRSFKANEVQRVFRGHLGRLITKAKRQEKLEARELSFFTYLCIQLQRCFRGYYSRKYKHDQARRKQYARMIAEQGELVRQNLQKYAEELAEREEHEREQKKDDDFKRLAQDLHHLMSTKRIPGVYKPVPHCNEMPTMKAIPVEEHIRGVVKDLLRTRGVTHTGLVTDLNGTKKVPLKGLKYKLSIQASAPYDTLEQEKRREKVLHRILTAAKGTFQAGGKTNIINKDTVPLSVGNPYMDPWANPMMVKGVPKDQKQLMDSTRSFKPLFTQPFTPLAQPFYPRSGGNKSTTGPNDVFDTIAEAEETGGSAQRFRGTGNRFGLSANMDNRTDGTIPKPPIRTSLLTTNTKTTLRKMTLRLQRHDGTGASGLPVHNRTRGGDNSSVHTHSTYSNDIDSSDEEEEL